uniref:Ig-like domain-containing protein n=1 Tax=Seriola lalandi dorsalis TaxID=1841481 RepID=A0A3B4WWS3_SERLL
MLTALTSDGHRHRAPVIQPTADVTAAEGGKVTLDCSFETSDTSNAYLFWYKQEENDFPKFLLRRYSGTKNTQDSQENRFNAEVNNKSVPLKIQKLQVSDSAVYYCALQPTVTGNTKTLESHTVTLQCLEDDITASSAEVFSSEGRTVTLSCNYSGSGDYLYWYQQNSSSSPQFLIADYSENTPGLSLQHDKENKEFHLNISSAAVTDSAVYYCALRPTVTGNTKTLYKNLWSKDNTILHNIH